MKRVMSLAALLTAVAMLAGCCRTCGTKSPKKASHKTTKATHMESHSKKKAAKPQSEYQKFCSKCDQLLKDCKCYL